MAPPPTRGWTVELSWRLWQWWAPPPTRGWTLDTALQALAKAGSPAHAGMDPRTGRARIGQFGLPRPRGDGPRPCAQRTRHDSAPPPTRGWTPPVEIGHARRAGSPAHAGMDPRTLLSGGPSRWLPRPRGDGPFGVAKGALTGVAPPPTRGWTRKTLHLDAKSLGSPAHAGMDPGRVVYGTHVAGLPRPRGDGPGDRGVQSPRLTAPPPTRGWTRVELGAPSIQHGSPAHAGMDPSALGRWARCRRLPRPRGDGPLSHYTEKLAAKAPPPTRGWTLLRTIEAACDAGSPAHAGMDRQVNIGDGGGLRLPRPRGDGPGQDRNLYLQSMAPPPTRGWTRRVLRAEGGRRGSPAHAGMDPSRRTPSRRRCGLPRPRGDGPALADIAEPAISAPPPTRGWTV